MKLRADEIVPGDKVNICQVLCSDWFEPVTRVQHIDVDEPNHQDRIIITTADGYVWERLADCMLLAETA